MLKLSSKGRQVFTSGEMVNLMSVDATKFQDITTYLNMVWSAPFQIITTLIFLYNLMGWSIFAGVATMSLLLPINYVVSNKIKVAQVIFIMMIISWTFYPWRDHISLFVSVRIGYFVGGG